MFKQRSTKKELLDADDIPDKDLFRNLKELNTINKLLGGYAISLNALKRILKKEKKYTIVDIGCGGGDTLKQINTWNKKQQFDLRLYGIDLKQTCVDYSRSNDPTPGLEFICDDYRNVYKHLPHVDIIHACLFCHHLSNEQLIDLIRFAQDHGAILLINDLERNAFAHYAIRFLTALFSKSYLVKNDAPLSVLRGFKKKEWLAIIEQSGAKHFSVHYRWAFRHEVIVYPDGRN